MVTCPLILFRRKNASDKSCNRKPKQDTLCSSENRVVYETMWKKCCTTRHAMRFECWRSKVTQTHTHHTHTHTHRICNIYCFSMITMATQTRLRITLHYLFADKPLARPGRKQARKHVRDARDFHNNETRAVIKFPPPPPQTRRGKGE